MIELICNESKKNGLDTWNRPDIRSWKTKACRHQNVAETHQNQESIYIIRIQIKATHSCPCEWLIVKCNDKWFANQKEKKKKCPKIFRENKYRHTNSVTHSIYWVNHFFSIIYYSNSTNSGWGIINNIAHLCTSCNSSPKCDIYIYLSSFSKINIYMM